MKAGPPPLYLHVSLPLSLSLGNKEALLYLPVSVALCLTTVQSLFSAALSAWGKWRERLREWARQVEREWERLSPVEVFSTSYLEVLF